MVDTQIWLNVGHLFMQDGGTIDILGMGVLIGLLAGGFLLARAISKDIGIILLLFSVYTTTIGYITQFTLLYMISGLSGLVGIILMFITKKATRYLGDKIK